MVDQELLKEKIKALYGDFRGCRVYVSGTYTISVSIVSECILPDQNMLFLGKMAQIFGTLDFRNDKNTESDTWQLSEVTSDGCTTYEHTYQVEASKIGTGLPAALETLMLEITANDMRKATNV